MPPKGMILLFLLLLSPHLSGSNLAIVLPMVAGIHRYSRCTAPPCCVAVLLRHVHVHLLLVLSLLALPHGQQRVVMVRESVVRLELGHGAQDEADHGGQDEQHGEEGEQLGEGGGAGRLHHVPDHLAQLTAAGDLSSERTSHDRNVQDKRANHHKSSVLQDIGTLKVPCQDLDQVVKA